MKNNRRRKKGFVVKIKGVLFPAFLAFSFFSAIWQVRYEGNLQERLAVYATLRIECTAAQARALLAEMEVFPVQEDETGAADYTFDDSYGAARTYGGARSHEGIDIMASNNEAGYFAVRSVCDGVVEKLGWLELGGYRVGVRGESGFYYYYAHLDAYADTVEIGKEVKAGEILGMMGNTGYGAEGTRGKFAVHLHFGIYYTQDGVETSLNPYPLLRYSDDTH